MALRLESTEPCSVPAPPQSRAECKCPRRCLPGRCLQHKEGVLGTAGARKRFAARLLSSKIILMQSSGNALRHARKPHSNSLCKRGPVVRLVPSVSNRASLLEPFIRECCSGHKLNSDLVLHNPHTSSTAVSPQWSKPF